jgi:hypothetical protein
MRTWPSHGRVALHAGDYELIRTASEGHQDAPYAPYTAAVLAEAAAMTQATGREQRLAEAERFAAENDFVAAHTTRVAGLLSGDRETLLGSVRRWEAIGARFERACTLVWIAIGRARVFGSWPR